MRDDEWASRRLATVARTLRRGAPPVILFLHNRYRTTGGEER